MRDAGREKKDERVTQKALLNLLLKLGHSAISRPYLHGSKESHTTCLEMPPHQLVMVYVREAPSTFFHLQDAPGTNLPQSCSTPACPTPCHH